MQMNKPVYLYPEEQFIESGVKVHYVNMKADKDKFEQFLNEKLSGKKLSISTKHPKTTCFVGKLPETIFIEKISINESLSHIVFKDIEESKGFELKLPYYNIYSYFNTESVFIQLGEFTLIFKEVELPELFETSDKVALYDKDGNPTYIITKTDNVNLRFDFKLEEVDCLVLLENDKYAVESTSFISSGIIKWDGCSHWYFYGEDYKEDDVKPEKDSYYHLCGFHSYFNHMIGLVFAFKVASIYIKEFNADEKEYFSKFEYLLKDYTIKDYVENEKVVE